MLLVINSTTKVRGTLVDNPNLKRRKAFSALFLLTKTAIIYYIVRGLFSGDSEFLFTYNILYVWFFTMMSIHLPTFGEYRYIRTSMILLSLKFIYQSFDVYMVMPGYLTIITSIATAIGFSLLLKYLVSVYKKSIKKALN
jgi:mannose/fructose/N-acetylgalactosamine-specific phosphotransferase system component IIC